MLLGPVITTVVIVTVGALIGPHEPLLGGPFMNWLIAVGVCVPLALVQGACMLGFGALRARGISVRCAWISALLAPLPVAAVWSLARPAAHSGVLYFIALFAPIVITAGLVRVGAALTCNG